MEILIAGATGQLGYTIAEKLRNSGHTVYALYRETSNIQPLEALGYVQFRKGNLLSPDTLVAAVEGIDVVICTANSASPSQKGDRFDNVDKAGVKSLIDASKQQGVKHFIYVSALPFGAYDDGVPLAKAKRYIEKYLHGVGLPYTIFQPTAFMDVYFAFFGTELPMAGTVVASVRRPFKFSNQFFAGIKHDIEEKGRFNLIGSGEQRNSYISIDSVAQFCVNAIGKEEALNRIIPIGGPEALSVLEVKGLFEEAYGKPLEARSTPLAVMKIMSWVLSPFNINAANIMALNYAGAKNGGVVVNAQQTAREFGVMLQSVREFIQEKMRLRER
jgi:uncharacterized protein YbjT (DUF2867 family)